jgi:NAD(P)-dependent dehydrogenase (short-subunit alcohol dehydrogenase family)
MQASAIMLVMDALHDKVAVVTGASRGVGKGIALGLAEAGATVYITGRSTKDDGGSLPGTIDETAAAVTKLGGVGIAVRCDHRIDGDVEALFQRVRHEHGRLDFLVNNAFASPEQRMLWSGLPFWELPISMWDELLTVGLRSHFVASRFAVPLMLEQGAGVIVNVSSHAAASAKPVGSRRTIPYSVVKAALHRLTADMATELRDSRVAVVALSARAAGRMGRPQRLEISAVDGSRPGGFPGGGESTRQDRRSDRGGRACQTVGHRRSGHITPRLTPHDRSSWCLTSPGRG